VGQSVSPHQGVDGPQYHLGKVGIGSHVARVGEYHLNVAEVISVEEVGGCYGPGACSKHS
jgi:hypothetical protein